MGRFFIDTTNGQVATHRQLVEAGIGDEHEPDPPRPWHQLQGSPDASTMWYAVVRKRTRGIFIGRLVLRHGEHHASLLGDGWEEVPIESIHAPGPSEGPGQPLSR